MRTYDLSPLWRSTIGFDRLFDLAEMAQERAGEDNYPPYNIERLAEDRYQISLAVAGFAQPISAITAEQNVVTIEGGKSDKTEPRRFPLSRHLEQQLQAAIQHGLITFRSRAPHSTMVCSRSNCIREIPEAMKPRRIAINGGSADNVHKLEAKAA